MKNLMSLAASLPGRVVDTAIHATWLLAWKTYRLAEWIERFEPQSAEQFSREQLRLVPGEYRS